MNPDVPIVLIGPSYAGKRASGSLLAQNTGRRLLDTDTIFAHAYGDRHASTPFYQSKFDRERESSILQGLLENGDSKKVIATGDGMLSHDNAQSRVNNKILLLTRALTVFVTPAYDAEFAGCILAQRYDERRASHSNPHYEYPFFGCRLGQFQNNTTLNFPHWISSAHVVLSTGEHSFQTVSLALEDVVKKVSPAGGLTTPPLAFDVVSADGKTQRNTLIEANYHRARKLK